jgi:hypothetical protein
MTNMARTKSNLKELTHLSLFVALSFAQSRIIASLVDDHESMTVQWCAYIADKALLFGLLPVVRLLATRFVLVPLPIFCAAYAITGSATQDYYYESSASARYSAWRAGGGSAKLPS